MPRCIAIPAVLSIVVFGCGDGAGSSADLDPSAGKDAGRDVSAWDGGGSEVGSASPDAGDAAATAPAFCPPVPDTSSALSFDGVDDDVDMGVAPKLGLSRLTIEAWVRRDGAGTATGTGVGGLSLVPIAGKGRGEDDGSSVDCNYAFGFWGDVLGADFEDMASGLNHPVRGKSVVRWGEWHHVAATFDGQSWRLYLDGKLDGEAVAVAEPRADSIQHFGIGAAFDSKGVAAGRLHGAVDELRVWNTARSGADIAAQMYRALTSSSGLVGRWLDQGTAADSVGGIDGAIHGAAAVKPGATLDRGLPPRVAAATPAEDAKVTGAKVDLGLMLTDPENNALSATFYLRELTTADDFSVVVLPDTQYYTLEGKNREHLFYEQTKWVVDHRDTHAIAAVIHNGDIVDTATIAYQWGVADTAMAALEKPLSGLPDGFPFGVAVGNHEQSPNGAYGGTADRNKHFGIARFQGRSYYGGHYGTDNDESFYTFGAGGLDFVVVNFSYNDAPDAAVLAWAKSIFEQHPGAFGIVNAHYILGAGGAFGTQGQAIYDTLRDVPNVHLLTCGHVAGESRRSDTHSGHIIHSMLADYQSRTNGGDGWMRLWELSPANNELTVRTYSPNLDKYETDADSEFTLPIDLRGAGGAFKAVATIAPAASAVTTTLSGINPGHTYEWYATVTDCTHTVASPPRRFTTVP